MNKLNKNSLDRRHFFKQSLAGMLGFSSASTLGLLANTANAAVVPSGSDFKTLVVVNLNGGNDSLNMLIPNTQDEYELYRSPRSNLAFDKPSLLPINPIGLEENSFAVHPRMQGVQAMFEEGDLAFVANVGGLVEPISKAEFLAPNRTKRIPAGLGGHNTQAAYWQADHSNRINTTGDGWGGRLANEFLINGILPTSIAINNGNNLFQRHATQGFYNVGLGGLIRMRDFSVGSSNQGILARRKAIEALNQLAIASSDPFTKHAGNLFEEGIELNMVLQTELADVADLSDRFAPPVSGTGGAFAASLARAAEMILIRENLNMRRQVIFVEQAGFDTHSRQAENHVNLMTDLSAYLTSFNSIMKDSGVHNSVITVTTSEFGRNLASNGDGTDHAWGAQHMAMGGPVDGKKIHGKFPSLVLNGPDDYNGLGRMIPTTSVTQYGATIAKWFGVPTNRLNSVFPNLSNFQGREVLEFLG